MQDLGVASHDTFNEFMYGFTAAHPAFIVVDCGKQKEAADAKIRSVVVLVIVVAAWE